MATATICTGYTTDHERRPILKFVSIPTDAAGRPVNPAAPYLRLRRVHHRRGQPAHS